MKPIKSTMEEINESIQRWTILQYAVPAILAVIFSLIGVIFWIYAQNQINRYQNNQRAEEQRLAELEQRKSALSGSIKSRIIDGQNSVTLHFGMSHITVSVQSLRGGMNLQPFSFVGDRNITITLKNDSLLVSADFRSLDGKVVAKIVDNEWQINSNNYFDRNYDENGLEIIDQEGITKFQIDYTDLYNIRIGGSFISSGSLYAFLPSGQSLVLGMEGRKKEEFIEIGKSITTLFLYPSKSNFGKRRELDQIAFYPEVILDFNKKPTDGKYIMEVSDTTLLKSIRFGGSFRTAIQLPIELKVTKSEIYFNGKLQDHGVFESKVLLSSNGQEHVLAPYSLHRIFKMVL